MNTRAYGSMGALRRRIERAAERVLSAPDIEWRDQALCRNSTTPDKFFPLDYTSDESATVRFLCRGCPVRKQCLDEGMEHRDGIWGGTTPRQRALMKGSAWGT